MAFVHIKANLQVHAIAASAGRNAQHTLPTASGPTGGTFTLTYGGYTTAAIAWNATAATIQAALQALPSIGANGVLVTGGPLNTTDVVINYIGPLANLPQTLITANNTNATGGTVVPASTTTGVVADIILSNPIGIVPTSFAEPSYQLGALVLCPPVAVTGATAQTLTYKFHQRRAGVLIGVLGGYTLVAGNSFVAETPVQVAVMGTPTLLAGDLIECQTQQTGATGLASPIGVLAQAEIA